MPTICLFASLALLAAPVPAPDEAAIRKKMESQWADLINVQPGGRRKSHAALIQLSLRPKVTTAFIAERLMPLKTDARQIKALLIDLGSDDLKTWTAAFDSIRYFDPRLVGDLKDFIDEAPTVNSKKRLAVSLISHQNPLEISPGEFTYNVHDEIILNFNIVAPMGTQCWAAERSIKNVTKPEWTRAEIALDLLEHFDTPEAWAVVTSMATGHPGAGPTIAAKAALARRSGP